MLDNPDHPDDIIRRVRDVLEVLWGDRAEAIEQEVCKILGVKDLRDYFRKPGNAGFWTRLIKRYSKSRRKAPIYCLLQSSQKNYAIWIYYHRLDKDILFKALVNYVEPKLRLADGWYLARTRGIHRQFKHPIKPGTVTVPGKLSKDLAIVTLMSIRRQSQLEDE